MNDFFDTKSVLKDLGVTKHSEGNTGMENMKKELNKALFEISDELDSTDFIKGSEAHQYKYLKLPDLLKILRPICKKHGVRINQGIEATEGGRDKLYLRFIHKDTGQQTASSCWLANDWNDYKGWGGEHTYKRRYMLFGELGISPADDSEEKTHEKKQYNNTTQNNSPKNDYHNDRPITAPQLKMLLAMLKDDKEYALKLLKEHGAFKDIPMSAFSKIVKDLKGE